MYAYGHDEAKQEPAKYRLAPANINSLVSRYARMVIRDVKGTYTAAYALS